MNFCVCFSFDTRLNLKTSLLEHTGDWNPSNCWGPGKKTGRTAAITDTPSLFHEWDLIMWSNRFSLIKAHMLQARTEVFLLLLGPAGRFLSDVSFGDEFGSKHHHRSGIRGREYDFGKMILIFPSPQIQLWPVCTASGKVTQRKEKTPLARSLLRRVFPPNPRWWLPKASKHDILCNCLRMIRSMQAILFFFLFYSPQGHKGRSFTHVNVACLHNTCQQD